MENYEAQHGNSEKEPLRDHSSVAWNMGVEVETFPQNHTKYVFCSSPSPSKYLKLLYVSGNDHSFMVWLLSLRCWMPTWSCFSEVVLLVLLFRGCSVTKWSCFLGWTPSFWGSNLCTIMRWPLLLDLPDLIALIWKLICCKACCCNSVSDVSWQYVGVRCWDTFF